MMFTIADKKLVSSAHAWPTRRVYTACGNTLGMMQKPKQLLPPRSTHRERWVHNPSTPEQLPGGRAKRKPDLSYGDDVFIIADKKLV